MEALHLAEIGGVLAVWFLAVASPGPSFLIVSQLAAGRSRAAAVGAALGIALGAMLFAVLTLWGLAVVVTQIAWLGTALRVAGALYLVYLGLSLFHAASGETASDPVPVPRGADFTVGLRIGALTSITNPKAIAFFLSLFAVALPPALPLAGKLTLLAAGFGIEIGWYVLVALVLSTGHLRALYARARKGLERVLGAALVLLGVRLGST
ncbi:Threonine efflux protein [Usitatibacter rugosus]|uniref:Threonine efflux protein n=1 Tax=Usitatibacter rugosus TaxID=2732067 RepID=A0A6M4GYR8_9PROT|nr:LysE family transporter [Usitatibacter rugosus]QJR12411.1 Threonine efflux protein [Usitatibacter rugosus]